MALKISTLLGILCILIVCVSYIQARSLTEELEEKDLERRLSILNKTPVLSFKTEDGIIHCIDIYKQPAFDNPLLNNHKIQYAVLKLKKLDRPYIFAKGSLNCQNPKADSGEASGAQIWVYGGDGNYISAGWMVNLDLYGDYLTRFTAFWKDQETKNWWLATGKDLVPIGHWPKELFSHLGNGASYIAYGGITKAVPTRVTPPMGSGIADSNFYHTAYFQHIQYKTDPNILETPLWSQTEIHVDCPNVYTVQHPCKIKPKGPNFAFMYGGTPGVC
ncbi:hypothetical protein CRG98_043933 [Punica granatum]|uniref:Neprosin PEP catalytic domain-containing protein n=1 Tax=Punica granatum TaxID=22663 RepID=A0A2I0HVE8_PUNGR|nr:hypothetical protein CRG98_043933 [Punica granatum]